MGDAASASVWILAAAGLAAAAFVLPAEAVEITKDGGFLSLIIPEPTPLEAVLSEIAAALSVEVKGGKAGTIVPASRLAKMTLPQILDRIVPDHAFALVTNAQGEPVRIVLMGGSGDTPDPNGAAIQEIAPQQRPRATAGGIEGRLRDIAKLSSKQDPETARELEAVAVRATEIEERIAAIHALGNFKSEGSMAFLRTRMLADPSPDVRVAAAEALQMADFDAARPMIEQALSAERDETQRERLKTLLDQ